MKIFSMWLVAVVLLTASIGNAQTYSPTYSTDLVFKNGANFLTLTPTGLSATFTLTLPTTNGATGQVLGLTGANALGWFTPIVSGVTAAGGDLTGTYPNPDIAAGAIVNADVNASAGIVYSKLNLTNSIVTGDLVDDNVTLAKIANAAANDVLVGSGNAGSGTNYTEITLNANLSMSGTALGLNLANANTWTATQTLPTTAAQGDALIASVNAGTTTIDAARIGAGLTDAQVNDNLTINGGTVDASPIGATTPSTGAFTTITGTALPSGSTSTAIVTSNVGVLETRTAASLSGIVPVATNATLVGDGTTGTPLGLSLANANTWTATQTLPTTAAQGDALIASVNAGTTTIDAARIGAGLTDAQVNNNLTINSGTVDATPIGATTASTGRFTTVEATTVLGAATTPGAGTYYRDNAIIAWGDIAAAGVVNDQFGNAAVVHTPGTGVYTVTLPNAPTAAATTATLQSLGLVTVTRAGAVLTITTYDTTGTPTDLDFYFITTGRP